MESLFSPASDREKSLDLFGHYEATEKHNGHSGTIILNGHCV